MVNRTLEIYLRCVIGDKPKKWLTWLPWVEYCYNTSYHTALQATPFRLVYGREPPRLLDYTARASTVDAVDRSLTERTEFLQETRARLAQAQKRMKDHYDGSHRLVTFEVGDYVWLKLQPYRQLTVARHALNKLSPRFFGPFEILGRIGEVAYRLQLPKGSRIHNVFHVSLLKPHKGPLLETATELPSIHEGRTLFKPHAVIRSRLNRGQRELLVQWHANAPESATWEGFEKFAEAYPDYELEDKLVVQEGSNDTDAFIGKIYQRKHLNHN